AAQAHMLVLGQILEQGGEALLQAHGHVDALDLVRRPHVEQMMPEGKPVAVQIPDRVVAISPRPVPYRLHHFDAACAMELVELVGIADGEEHRASLRAGGTLLQEDLNAVQVHACERGRVAPGEAQAETELRGVELGGGQDVADAQARVVLLTVDLRWSGKGHRTVRVQWAETTGNG